MNFEYLINKHNKIWISDKDVVIFPGLKVLLGNIRFINVLKFC